MEEKILIGTLLRTQREHLKFSVEDIANKTKININILKSLEESNLTALPNKTYVKGFVRSYAKTLGILEADALDSLEETYHQLLGEPRVAEEKSQTLGSLQSENTDEAENEEMKETFNSIIQGFFNKKILLGLAAIMVLAVIGKGIGTFFSNLNDEKETVTVVSEPNSENPEPMLKPTDANILEMDASKKLANENIEAEEIKREAVEAAEKKKAEVAEAIAIANENKRKEEEATKAKAITAAAEKKKAEIAKAKVKAKPLPAGKFPFKKFYPAPVKMYDVVDSSEDANNPAILPPNIKAAMIKGKQNVYIVATKQDTWISYQTDDQAIKRFVLKQGRRVLIKGERILLFMGNFNAAKVFLNNKLVSAKSKTGVKSMIFPQSLASEYELPLFPSYKGVPYSANVYKENMVENQ